jgi:glycine hydroxymethyltransferase
LGASLAAQAVDQRMRLILNPVENVPFAADLAAISSSLHGLYNSDKVRTAAQRAATPIQFSGRQAIEEDAGLIYRAWAEALRAGDATLRLLSGLHAHIVLFMSISSPGQSVLLVPVTAGGHLSARAILERLGLRVIEMVVDEQGLGIDVEATIALCADDRPDFVLMDRSEGLTVEDMSAVAALAGEAAVFDGSQYLTNIICGHHPNPFDAGFGLIIASTHKNFPGPQKALIATQSADERWRRVLAGVSTYVSNMHPMSIYAAGLALARTPWLRRYSERMLILALRLESELHEAGVPVVRRRTDLVPTHHLWIREESVAAAYETYERLERCGIETNFRLLPYSLGHGLRLGTAAVARLGMVEDDVPQLARLIARVRSSGATAKLQREVRGFNRLVWSRFEP